MENDFLTTKVDKFKNLIYTETTYPYVVKNEFNKATVANIHHRSTPNGDSLTIEIFHVSGGWIFLRNGRLIFNINNVENISVNPYEVENGTLTGDIAYYSNIFKVDLEGLDDVHCWEHDSYEISQDLLKKICDANTLDIQIIGGSYSFDVNANDFINYSRQFYNAFYDNDAYKGEIYKASSNSNTSSNSNKGCTYYMCLIMGYFFMLMGLLFLFIGFNTGDVVSPVIPVIVGLGTIGFGYYFQRQK